MAIGSGEMIMQCWWAAASTWCLIMQCHGQLRARDEMIMQCWWAAVSTWWYDYAMLIGSCEHAVRWLSNVNGQLWARGRHPVVETESQLVLLLLLSNANNHCRQGCQIIGVKDDDKRTRTLKIKQGFLSVMNDPYSETIWFNFSKYLFLPLKFYVSEDL